MTSLLRCRRTVLIVLGIWLAGCGAPSEPRRIAITLDDAPLARPLSYPSEWDRGMTVDSLTQALVSRGVPATVFVIGRDLEDPNLSTLLSRWTSAGIQLGNHSLTHRSFSTLPYRAGVSEVTRTQAMLATMDTPERVQRLFRFPFLEEGRTLAVRDRWIHMLDSLDLKPARVSITTDDWRFDNRYEEAELAQDWDARFQVGQEYLEHVKESVRYWDAQAQDIFGRNVRHVLMLHANRINRDYLGHILDWLRDEGYEFIPLHEAYKDALYTEPTTWLGPSGVSVIESVKQTRLADGRYP